MKEDIQAKANELHQNIIVVDQTAPLLGSDTQTFKLWQRGGVTAVAPTIASNHDAAGTVARLGAWLRFIDTNQDSLLLVKEPSDLIRAKAEQRLGIIFHFQNTLPLGLDVNLVAAYHELGVRMIQLAYNQKNFVGDGCEERTDAGLSKFGIEVVKELNRLGIIVDVSHCGYRTAMEAAEFSHAPVICSHSNIASVYPSPRNVNDEQIEAIANTGGLIGVVGFPAFISELSQPSVSDLIRHIDHVVDLVGVDHVGIGIDYFELMSGFTSDDVAQRWYDSAVKDGRWSEGTYPPPPWHYPSEISDPSKLSALTYALSNHGYSDDDVRKIMGGNFLRVFQEVRERRQ